MSGETRKGLTFSWQRAIRDDPALSKATKLVALVLSTYFNEKRVDAYPSAGTLAKLSGLSRRTVGLRLVELTNRGYIKAERRGRPGKRGYFRIFTPTFPAPEGSASGLHLGEAKKRTEVTSIRLPRCNLHDRKDAQPGSTNYKGNKAGGFSREEDDGEPAAPVRTGSRYPHRVEPDDLVAEDGAPW